MIHPFQNHPLFHRHMRRVLQAGIDSGKLSPAVADQARAILADSQSVADFGVFATTPGLLRESGITDPLPPPPPNPNHPFIAWIESVFTFFINNPQTLAAIIQMFIKLFGGG